MTSQLPAKRKSHSQGLKLNSVACLFLGVSLLLATFRSHAGAQNDSYAFSINTHQVTDIFFSDSVHGWVSVKDNRDGLYSLLRTLDGGRSWRRNDAPKGLVRVFFLDASSGWALQATTGNEEGQDTLYLLRTTDSGKTWKPVSSSPVMHATAEGAGRFAALAFTDERRGWVSGYGNRGTLLAKTADGGETVTSITNLSLGLRTCYGIYASRDAGIWIYGDGFALHSADEGRTWVNSLNFDQLKTNARLVQIYGATFYADGRGWLVGYTGKGVILGTRNFGLDWTPELMLGIQENVQSISSWDEKHACAMSGAKLMFCTDNGGQKWERRILSLKTKSGQADFFPKMVIKASGLGWVLRAGGYLYRTTDGGKTWLETDALSLPSR